MIDFLAGLPAWALWLVLAPSVLVWFATGGLLVWWSVHELLLLAPRHVPHAVPTSRSWWRR